MKLNLLCEDKFKSIVAIVYDEHANVLLGKATNNDDRKGKWCFPAGKIEAGECPGEAATRECEEETGIVATPKQMSFGHDSKPEVGFVVCKKLSGTLSPNSEFSELQWVPWNKVLELPDLYYDIPNIMSRPIARLP